MGGRRGPEPTPPRRRAPGASRRRPGAPRFVPVDARPGRVQPAPTRAGAGSASSAPPGRPRSREEARLLLAVLHTTGTDSSQRLAPQDIVMRALEVAAEWPGDEEIVAGSLGLALMTTANMPLPDQLVVRLRALQEDYFARFPDSKTLQRIEIGEDLDGLCST
jgi:hypothetical protein